MKEITSTQNIGKRGFFRDVTKQVRELRIQPRIRQAWSVPPLSSQRSAQRFQNEGTSCPMGSRKFSLRKWCLRKSEEFGTSPEGRRNKLWKFSGRRKHNVIKELREVQLGERRDGGGVLHKMEV